MFLILLEGGRGGKLIHTRLSFKKMNVPKKTGSAESFENIWTSTEGQGGSGDSTNHGVFLDEKNVVDEKCTED